MSLTRTRRGAVAALGLAAGLPALLAAPAGADHVASPAPFVRHGAPVPVSPPGVSTFGAPFVVADGSGRRLVVWNDAAGGWRARLFDAAGVPLGGAIELGLSTVDVTGVAMAGDGGWAVTWADFGAVWLRRFAPNGVAGLVTRLDSTALPPGSELIALERPSIAMTLDGDGIALWVQRLVAPGSGFEGEFRRLVSRRFAADGQPIGEEVERAVWLADQVPFQGGFDAAFNFAGRALLATVAQSGDPSFGNLSATLLAADGTEVQLDPAAAELHPSADDPRVAADGHGSFALAFTGGAGQGPHGRDGSCTGAFVRFYAADGTALAPERRVHPETLGCQGLVDVAGVESGWLVLWSGAPADPFFGTDASREGFWLTTYDENGDQVGAPVRLLPPVGGIGSLPRIAGGLGRAAVAEQRFTGVRLHLLRPAGDAACPAPGPAAPLCLGDGRFRVDLAFRDPYNGGGIGDVHAVPLAADTGAFWFFRPDNLELMLKVLDARPVNGHWWVFYGGLTTVETWIDVTDLGLGRHRSYYNPAFVQSSRADTAAFDDPARAGEETAALAVPPLLAARTPPRAHGIDLAAGALPARPAAPAEEPPACADGPDRLCLHGRFLVEVDWHNPRDGGRGEGRAVPINGGTGAFWFFDPGNLELLVKVIDGRPANGHWWVFHGGLSDVEYTITVRDTFVVREVSYHSPPFELTGGADTAAFPAPAGGLPGSP